MALTITVDADGTRTISGLSEDDMGTLGFALSPTMQGRMSSDGNRNDVRDLLARLDSARRVAQNPQPAA